MTSQTVKRDQDIDPEAFARWNNDGGAVGPREQGASRLRLLHAVELHPRSGHKGIPLIATRVSHRKQQFEKGLAVTPACASHDTRKEEPSGLGPCPATQAEQDPRRENRAAGVSYDVWRFSCEMPDAPHLINNLMPL
jgi:hypothetical protein